jgi:hypothetical protein
MAFSRQYFFLVGVRVRVKVRVYAQKKFRKIVWSEIPGRPEDQVTDKGRQDKTR